LRPTNEWQDRLSFISPDRFMHVSVRNSFGTFNARRLARFIDEKGIQIVHAHVARDYLTTSIACRSARTAKFAITRHLILPLKPFHRFALRNVDAAIAVSPGIKSQLEKTFGPDRITVIPNGISAGEADADARAAMGAEFRSFHNIPSDAPLVAAIGELKVLKGQRDLVLAANEVLKRFPECRFVLAGRDNSIDQHFRRELRRLVRVLGYEERFLWLDWMHDVSPLLAAADLFVSASHFESFGLAILEAMAAGTPVIATETDGARQLIRDREALVAVRDPVALAEGISHMIAEPGLPRNLGDEQLRDAAEMFSLGRMVDATERVYQQMIDG
jgi:glycosyltransferase involved in cell wall biosynthesis